MNFIFISPHFPSNYKQFVINLKKAGINVLGIANESYENLDPELKNSLTEYYKVEDMHDYDSMVRACGFFTHKYGKIDRIESLNEYWLEMDAALRTDFNIFGQRHEDMPERKRKSLMKNMFKKIGLEVAKGTVVETYEAAKKLSKTTGFPVVVKPDIGVGAAKTYKIDDLKTLKEFFDQKSHQEYIMEEYIDGTIVTFDGLTDINGNLVFSSSLEYSQGAMETVVDDSLMYYYTVREIPEELEAAGTRLVKAYGLKERFFHFEFFRRNSDQKLLGLEVNMRPPGGFTTDMMNYSNNFDIYREWAQMIANGEFGVKVSRDYYCAYICRKFKYTYKHSHENILSTFGAQLMFHTPMSGVFRDVMGDYGYIVRTRKLSEIHDIAKYIHKSHL